MRASTNRITFVLRRDIDTFCEARRLLPVEGSMQATTPSTTALAHPRRSTEDTPRQRLRVTSLDAHSTTVRSGFPFSTTYVASSAPLPLATFFAAWIVPAGMNRTPPGLSVTGGLPST